MSSSRKKLSKPRKQQKHTLKNKLPLAVIIIGGFTIIIAVLIAFQNNRVPFSPEVIGNPGLKVDQQKIDLGDVKLGKTVQTSFKITNVGDQPLKFTSVPYVEVVEGC